MIIGDNMDGIEYIKSRRNDDSLIITLSEGYFIEHNEMKNQIDEKLLEDYINRIFRIINDWEPNYNNKNNNLIDGDDWELVITFEDGYQKEYHGYNQFPYNYSEFERINYELIRKVFYGLI